VSKAKKWQIMAPFWRENQLVQTKKKELKRRAHDEKKRDAS
jgi:hypothetical protein